jgi:outer membrane lipoprotein-sorting protein
VVALAGCARLLPPPRAPVAEDARRAVALLTARWQEFADLRTLADIEFQRGQERQRLTGVLLARAPASVRFEALSPFGHPLLLVTIDDGWLRAYNTAAHTGWVAPATADTTARFLHLPFEPHDLVAVLGGLTVPPRDLRVAELVPPDGHGPALDMTGRIHHQRVWMDLDTGLVRRVAMSGGRVEAVVTFHRWPDGTPAGFDVVAGEGWLRVSVRYRDPVIDGGVDPGRFSLTLPAGARIEEVR